MKFPWVRCGDGLMRPLLRCGFRRRGVVLAAELIVLVDTGADASVLPFAVASLLGFSTSDLASADTRAVGGIVKTWTTTAAPEVESEIGGHWLMLPRLGFAENTPALLGRDVLFSDFELRMTDNETELRPRPTKT